jgi:aspartate kinase
LSEKNINGAEIAGIAGRTDFSIVCVEKWLMNKEVGFAHQLLGILREHQISCEQCPSRIDTISHIFVDNQLNGPEDIIAEEILKCRQRALCRFCCGPSLKKFLKKNFLVRL